VIGWTVSLFCFVFSFIHPLSLFLSFLLNFALSSFILFFFSPQRKRDFIVLFFVCLFEISYLFLKRFQTVI
jgi:4-hydroxybenzoate polyprenyltransferase